MAGRSRFSVRAFRGVYGLSYDNLGYTATVTRYLDDWFGLEGTVQTGWGHTNTTPEIPRALDAKSLFVGGGPHVAFGNRTRFEPWGHVIVGLEHLSGLRRPTIYSGSEVTPLSVSRLAEEWTSGSEGALTGGFRATTSRLTFSPCRRTTTHSVRGLFSTSRISQFMFLRPVSGANLALESGRFFCIPPRKKKYAIHS